MENKDENPNCPLSTEPLSIEIRSDEVQEILSRVPNWMIRWGISLILGMIVLFLFLAWLIRYPDVITGTATLTTASPPIKLVVKSSGEIQDLKPKDNSIVQNNQVIASIRSTLSSEANIFLQNEIPLIRKSLESKSLEKFSLKNTPHVFGEIQSNYNALITAIKNYSYLLNENNTPFNISNTSKQIENQKSLYNLTSKQLQNTTRLVQNAENKFKSDKILFDKGVISQSEYYEREKAYETALNEIQSLEKNKIQIAITITDLEKTLNDLKFNFEQEKKNFLMEIETNLSAIENALATWNSTYQLVSPIKGRISYLQTISENQFIEQGKELFAIIPENQDFIAHLQLSKSGYGKVKSGQKVMLKLDNFPSHEYGQLVGKVQSVSLIPNEDNYLVKVKLDKGLNSTYKRELNYTPEMTGMAEIITEDLRITDRIFNKLKAVFE